MSALALGAGWRLRCAAAALCLCTLPGCALFSGGPQPTADSGRSLPGEEAPGQVIDPHPARPETAAREIDAQDYEVGAYVAALAVNRGRTLGLYGLRAAYHKTEHFFVEAEYALASTVGYDEARELLGVAEAPDVDYDSFAFNLGYNLLPGELYVSDRYTLPIMLYGLAGVGYASYENEDFTAYNLGLGLKLLPRDWLSVRLELRDHAWAADEFDQNAVFSVGLAVFF